jgi:hypothetical protein
VPSSRATIECSVADDGFHVGVVFTGRLASLIST